MNALFVSFRLAEEKLYLGWLDPKVIEAGDAGTHTLAAAGTAGSNEALQVLLPDVETTKVVGDPYDAAYAAAVLAELRDDEYLGALPRAHLSALMAQAAVTLMPVDWDEPFGLVAAEAQMAGCPVVAYRRGALGEVVADGTSGFLVNPGDEELLPGAIAAASRLDRRAVRASAMARLGVARMIAAYEAALAGVQHAARTVA